MVSRHQAFNLALLLSVLKWEKLAEGMTKSWKLIGPLPGCGQHDRATTWCLKLKLLDAQLPACMYTNTEKTNKQTNKQTKNNSSVNLSLDVHLISRYAYHCMLWIYHFSMTTAELKTWACFWLCNCMSTVLGGHYRRSDRLQGTHSSTVFFHLSSKPLPLDVQTENGAYDSL